MTDRPSNVLTGCSVLPPLDRPPQLGKRVTQDRAPKPKPAAHGDRFTTINNFVDFTLAGLTGNEAAVWLVLWRDTKDGTARTAQSDIARRAGIGRRTVIRVVGRLEAKGLLARVHRGGLNRGMNVYRVVPLGKPP